MSVARVRPSLERPVFLWAVGGVMLLLVQALVRLTPVALEPLQQRSLAPVELGLYVGWAVANLYLEGYRGFQRRFVPRVLARAAALATGPRRAAMLWAPLHAMGLFGARRRTLISAWTISALIVAAVLLVRRLPQPWRGLIDAGVVAGLAWGLCVLLLGALRVLRGAAPPADPDAQAGEETAAATDAVSAAGGLVSGVSD
jgi:hypothetical protein